MDPFVSHENEAAHYLSTYTIKPRERITYYNIYLLLAFCIYIVVAFLSLLLILSFKLISSYVAFSAQNSDPNHISPTISPTSTAVSSSKKSRVTIAMVEEVEVQISSNDEQQQKKKKKLKKLTVQRVAHWMYHFFDRLLVFWFWFLVGFPFVLLSMWSLVPIEASIPVASLFFIIGGLQVLKVDYRTHPMGALATDPHESSSSSLAHGEKNHEKNQNHHEMNELKDSLNANDHNDHNGGGDGLSRNRHRDISMDFETTQTSEEKMMNDSQRRKRRSGIAGFLAHQSQNVVHCPLDVLLGIKLCFIPAVLIVVIMIALAIALILPTCYLCLAEDYSSTKAGRTHEKKLCEEDKICRVYFTVPHDMSQSMIVNFHSFTETHPNSSYVIYSLVSNDNTSEIIEQYTTNAKYFHMSEIIDESRYQFWADLVDLTPNSTYSVIAVATFKDGTHNWEARSDTKLFRTAPSLSSNSNISFVSGGDMEWSKAGIELTRVIGREKPLFAIIGGDIAYENGIPHCYMVMDRWFHNWERYTERDDGYSTPILTAIGNHEAGGFRKKRKQAAFYFRYFPHEIGLKSLQSAPSYHEHVFAQHLVIYILDSHVIAPIKGTQTDWLKNRTVHIPADRTNRIAIYHASAYPVRPTEIADIVYDLRTYMVPVFEQYDFSVVFEHHHHVYFESLPIRDTRVVMDEHTERGIRYLGQGAWGLTPRQVSAKMWYLDQHHAWSHVYHSTCSVGSCNVRSLIYDTKSRTVVPHSEHTIQR